MRNWRKVKHRQRKIKKKHVDTERKEERKRYNHRKCDWEEKIENRKSEKG